MSSEHTLVVGIGSSHGDDQIGWLVADRLAAVMAPNQLEIRRAASPMDLLDWLDDVDRLIICDACRGLKRVGQIRRWNWPTSEIPAVAWSGTHDLSLPAVLALAQRLGRLPNHVVVWAIEGAIGSAGETPSAGVAAAIPAVAQRILGELPERAPLPEHRCTNSR